MKDMPVNQFQSFLDPAKRRISQYLVETSNKRINRAMKKLQELYFSDSVFSKSNMKGKAGMIQITVETH